MSTSEILNLVAAAASAIGGGFAAVAAFRSASSARRAELSVDEVDRQAGLRQLLLTAKEVEIEARRCGQILILAGRSCNDLAVFSGGFGSTPHQRIKDSLAEKTDRVGVLEQEGKLFGTWPSTLEGAPRNEIDRVLTKMHAFRLEVSAMRNEVESQRADIERQCDVYRMKVVA